MAGLGLMKQSGKTLKSVRQIPFPLSWIAPAGPGHWRPSELLTYSGTGNSVAPGGSARSCGTCRPLGLPWARLTSRLESGQRKGWG